MNKPGLNDKAAAFTLIEMIITVVILAIVALMAVPMMSGAADIQVRSAANRLAADLEYAKNMAITHQRPFTVVFDSTATATNGYRIVDQLNQPIINPISRQDFVVTFASERSLSRVRIPTDGITLDPDSSPKAIAFDYLGTPSSDGQPLNSGVITLAADGVSLTVNIEPMTGYVTIDN